MIIAWDAGSSSVTITRVRRRPPPTGAPPTVSRMLSPGNPRGQTRMVTAARRRRDRAKFAVLPNVHHLAYCCWSVYRLGDVLVNERKASFRSIQHAISPSPPHAHVLAISGTAMESADSAMSRSIWPTWNGSSPGKSRDHFTGRGRRQARRRRWMDVRNRRDRVTRLSGVVNSSRPAMHRHD